MIRAQRVAVRLATRVLRISVYTLRAQARFFGVKLVDQDALRYSFDLFRGYRRATLVVIRAACRARRLQFSVLTVNGDLLFHFGFLRLTDRRLDLIRQVVLRLNVVTFAYNASYLFARDQRLDGRQFVIFMVVLVVNGR